MSDLAKQLRRIAEVMAEQGLKPKSGLENLAKSLEATEAVKRQKEVRKE